MEKEVVFNFQIKEILYDFHARLRKNHVEDQVEEENEDAIVIEVIYPSQLCAQPPIFHRRPQLMHTNAPSRVEVTDHSELDAKLVQEHRNEREILDEMEITRDYPRCVHPTHQHTRPPHSYPKDIFENCPSTPPAERERREKAEGLPAASSSSSRKYTKSKTAKTPKSQVPKCPPKPRGRPRKHPLPPVVNKPPPPPRKPITIKLAQNYDLPPPAQDKATFALGPSRTPAPNVDLMEGSSHMFVSQHPEASGSSRTQYNEFDVDPQEDTSRLLYRQFEERRVPSRTQQVDDSEQSERVRDKKKKKEEKHRTDEEATMSDAIDSKKRHKQKKEKKEKKHKHDREETAEEREERRRLKKERKRQEKADRKRQRAPSSTSEAPVAKKQKQKEVSPRPCFKLLIHIGKPTVAPVTALQPVASSSSQVPTSSHAVPSWQPTAPPVPSSRPIPPPSRSAPQPVPVNHGIFAEAMKPRPALAKIPAQPKAPALSKPPYAPKVKKEKESHSSHRTHSRRTSEKIISERVQMSKALKESLSSIEKKEKKETKVPVVKKKKLHKKKEYGSLSKTALQAPPKPEVDVEDSHSNGEWPCPVCSIPYTELGESMVGCDTCANWYHYSCVGLTHETVPRDDDPWFCANCKG